MAKSPTHYRLTVNRPIEVAKMNFNPGAKYTVKASVHDTIKGQAADAIASAEPMMME